MLYTILGFLDQKTTVVFDRFGKKDFELNIIDKMQSINVIEDIYAKDSQLDPGLQFVDNICSVIRLHLSHKDRFYYYNYIENIVTEINGEI